MRKTNRTILDIIICSWTDFINLVKSLTGSASAYDFYICSRKIDRISSCRTFVKDVDIRFRYGSNAKCSYNKNPELSFLKPVMLNDKNFWPETYNLVNNVWITQLLMVFKNGGFFIQAMGTNFRALQKLTFLEKKARMNFQLFSCDSCWSPLPG